MAVTRLAVRPQTQQGRTDPPAAASGRTGTAPVPVTDYLTTADLIGIHKQLIATFGGDAATRDRGALKAALFRPQTGEYADIIEEAAALMESLTVNRPFAEGNMRTAFAATDVFLRMNGHRFDGDPETTATYLVYLKRAGDFRFEKLVPWLRDLTCPATAPSGASPKKPL